MEEKKNQTVSQKNTVNVLGGLCSTRQYWYWPEERQCLIIMRKCGEMETVIASVLPEGYPESYTARDTEDSFSCRSRAGNLGNVFPTEDTAEEALAGDAQPENTQPEETQSEETQSEEIQSEEVPLGKVSAGEIREEARTDRRSFYSHYYRNGKRLAADSAETAVKPLEAPGEGQMYYAVQDGETLYSICFKLYQSVNSLEDICAWNGIGEPG